MQVYEKRENITDRENSIIVTIGMAYFVIGFAVISMNLYPDVFVMSLSQVLFEILASVHGSLRFD